MEDKSMPLRNIPDAIVRQHDRARLDAVCFAGLLGICKLGPTIMSFI